MRHRPTTPHSGDAGGDHGGSPPEVSRATSGSASVAARVSRNAAILIAGHALSYAMRIVYIGVLARYAGPDGVGRISTATSLVAILVLLVTFGLDTLIVRDVAAHPERTGDVASQATVLRLGLTIVYCAVLLGVTVFSAYPHETRVIIGIYGLAYILDNLYGVARSVFHAHQQMVYGAAIEVGRDLINVAASLVAIHLGWSLPAIVAISAVVSLAKLLAGWAVLRLRFARFTLRIRRRDAIAMLQRAMPFAAVLALGVLYAQMNTVMLSWWKPEEAVGLFSAAVMPVGILLIVPSMFMESIFPAFSAYADAGSPGLVRAYRASFRALLLIGLAMGAGTMVVAGPVIGIIYGPDFAGAAPVLRVLAVQLLSMVGYVNGALLQATGRQIAFARVRAGLTALNAVLCLLLIRPLGYMGAALAAVIPGAIDMFLYTAWCHRSLGLGFPWRLIGRAACCATAMALATFLGLRVGVPLVVVVLLVAPTVYGVALVALRVLDREEYQYLSRVLQYARWRKRLLPHSEAKGG